MAINENKQEIALFKLIQKLYRESYCPKDKIIKYNDYYLGKFEDQFRYKNLENTNNIIKQIVDTKSTLILDAMMETSVIPSNLDWETFQKIKQVQDIADIMNDCLKHALRQNNFETKKHRIVRDGLISGFIGVETVWNPDLSEGLGDVQVDVIAPSNLRWEKSAKNVQDSTYLFIEYQTSVYELKKKYAVNAQGEYDEAMADKIDQLVKGDAYRPADKGKPKAIVTTVNDTGAQQAFVYDSQGIKEAGKTVKLVKCYIKDDSVAAPDTSDTADIKEGKQFLKYNYPNGRCIIFSGDEQNPIIFEDKPIDYKFGFPVTVFNPIDLDNIESKGEVEDLIFVQDRINRAYARLQVLIGKFISVVCVDARQLDLKEEDFVNSFVVKIDEMQKNGVPTVLTNNTLSEIQNLLGYIQQLKNDAKEIARINDIMMSGELPSGAIKSGEMVKALVESPQSSIRALQRAWRDFQIEVSKKCISLIQDFYKNPRILRIGEGKQFVRIQEGKIEVFNATNSLNGSLVSAEKEMHDFSLANYEVEIVAGTEIPRTRNESSQLIEKLFMGGAFGDPKDPDILEQYLRSQDLPNYRGWIALIKDKQQQSMDNVQPVVPPTKDISVSFKDLPAEAQIEWLQNNGFPESAQVLVQQLGLGQQPQAMPEEMPAQQPMPMEGTY